MVHPTLWWGLPSHVVVFYTRGLVGIFSLFHIPECLHIFFKLDLSGSFTFTSIEASLSTFVASNVIQISPGSLFLLFYVAFVVPKFSVLRKHDLVADPVRLRISIGFIIRLMV